LIAAGDDVGDGPLAREDDVIMAALLDFSPLPVARNIDQAATRGARCQPKASRTTMVLGRQKGFPFGSFFTADISSRLCRIVPRLVSVFWCQGGAMAL
jgi:hypothetical protein